MQHGLGAAGVADAAHGVALGVRQAGGDGDLVERRGRDAADHEVRAVVEPAPDPAAAHPYAVRGRRELVDPGGQPQGAGAQRADEGVHQGVEAVGEFDLAAVEEAEVVDQDLQQRGLLVVGEAAGVAVEVPGVLGEVVVDELPEGHRGRAFQRGVVPVAVQGEALLLGGEGLPDRAEDPVQQRGRLVAFLRPQGEGGEQGRDVLDPDPSAAQVVVGPRVAVDERAGREPEAVHVVEYAVVVRGDAHRAEVGVGAVPEPVRAHPAARVVAAFVDHDVEAAPLQLVRAHQSGDAGADHDHAAAGAGHRVQQGPGERETGVEHRRRPFAGRPRPPD